MLAERVKQWSRELKEEGRQEGLQKGLQKGRREGIHAFQDVLLSEVAERFGPVSEETRRRIKSIQDLDKLKALVKRLVTASSLDDLGL